MRAAPRIPILSGAISGVALLGRADAGAQGGIEQHGGGNLEALDAAEADVLVLDVDEHVRVDGVQRGEPSRPVDGVVATPQGDEVPCGIFGPLVGPLVAADVGTRLVRSQPAESVVEDAVNSGGGID